MNWPENKLSSHLCMNWLSELFTFLLDWDCYWSRSEWYYKQCMTWKGESCTSTYLQYYVQKLNSVKFGWSWTCFSFMYNFLVEWFLKCPKYWCQSRGTNASYNYKYWYMYIESRKHMGQVKNNEANVFNTKCPQNHISLIHFSIIFSDKGHNGPMTTNMNKPSQQNKFPECYIFELP